MKLKQKIKKVPGFLKLYRYIKFTQEYNYDCKFFRKNYLYSKESKNTIGYDILLLSHSLEKGMANKKIRCFGKEKTEKLINKLQKYNKYNQSIQDFALIVGINVLREYINIYENNNWTNKEEYIRVKEFLKQYEGVKTIDVRSKEIEKTKILKDATIDYNKFLQSRHSIRNFSNKKLSEIDIAKAIDMTLKTPTACNRQMCNIYYVKNKKLSNFLVSIGQGFGGFEKENLNIFVITFDVNANYFVGERNQGWFNTGLVSMNFVNALHSLGIGTCFVQFGNSHTEEEKIKKTLNIPKNERIAVLLAAGYYDEKNLVTASPRKNIESIYKVIE